MRRPEELLKRLAGPDAQFREHQREAITDLVDDRARVLCVQRTGWGKSAVYFLATSLLREQGAGPALIVSPLLALMRNQIAAAEKLGIRAHTINSTNRDGWDEVRQLLETDAVDLLLISPERLNNPQFRNSMLPLFAERVGLLVVDEAHCISDWGHDFRPDYRRLQEMLERLPQGVAVLCTTATANDRVVADVAEQLQLGGHAGALKTYRGPLGRKSLRLEVVDLPAQADRLAWLATHLPQLPGSGIVYTLTKRDADTVAEWLNGHGVPAEAYSGEVATERRVGVEERLLNNDLKAVVATSALGMGYDKPDLGFVVHYQAPGSVISYYQQVGRAGRAIERADVVLLRGREDRRIQDFFIEQAFPPKDRVDRVLEALDDDGGATTNELMGAVNLGKSRIEAMLKVLDVEGAVSRNGTRWTRVPGSDWTYDGDRYAHVTQLRRHEQEAMAAFGADGRCLMRVLLEELDDPDPQDCGVCAICTAPKFNGELDARLVREAALHLRSRPLILDVKKMAPDAEGKMKKLGDDVRSEEGRALARLGDGGWDPLIQAGRREGRFGDELVEAAAEAVRSWRAPVRWVAAVPSKRTGTLVPDFARRLAEALELPFHPVLQRVGDNPPQREMTNSVQQVANVRGEFAVTQGPPPGACLLVDDVRFSGWTLAMVAGQLRRKGSGPVHPLALSTAY
ncbi:RecQ family ATP-dependent DNA helicase [Solirubrobacter ginsenosidimutans]|uniref:DNA 3'-5' helicase n=1 Tax=Solirubrobacter ginsenosidimutans TaxID=490573 RepID=A0A9X3S6Y6_9ACTN|nr:RecQ family ATP-dependent DNA helicase [Solirubrobacter ginsenosidimutans]MDA0165586.1 RecQ family ATP-dependent DNA helicase [Solirubrobacter ginsenosidimutans]